ncbi:MAG TPA: hypothetical protein PLJ74_05270 [Myxococcota bacterium]|nr:hypothetical protein [Myxococcota bacterium]
MLSPCCNVPTFLTGNGAFVEIRRKCSKCKQEVVIPKGEAVVVEKTTIEDNQNTDKVYLYEQSK